jgi:peptidyl-prolyl cis-trans isomerase SurA
MKSRRRIPGIACILAVLALRPAGAQTTAPAAAPSATLSSSQSATIQDNLDQRFTNGIAAIAETKIITVDDVRHEIAPLLPQIYRSSHNQQELAQQQQALIDDTIQGLVDRVLIVKEFRKPKGDEQEQRHIPDSYIDEEIARRQVEQFDNDRSKFLAYLRSIGKTMKEFRVDVEEDIIVGYMKQQQKKSQSIVSPVKIELYYKENKERFYQQDQVHLRMIQLTRAEGETDVQLKVRADEVLKRFKAGEKFEDLAKIYSQDPKRSKGGDYGWLNLTEAEMKSEFRIPLLSAKKGEVPDIVMLPDGCYLLYVEDRRYAGIQPLDAVRPEIEMILTQQMASISLQNWLERLRRNAYVKYY